MTLRSSSASPLEPNRKVLQDELAKKGMKLELTTFDGGSAASVALDITYSGNNPSLRLPATGADVKRVGLSSWMRTNETKIVVNSDSPIKTIQT